MKYYEISISVWTNKVLLGQSLVHILPSVAAFPEFEWLQQFLKKMFSGLLWKEIVDLGLEFGVWPLGHCWEGAPERLQTYWI